MSQQEVDPRILALCEQVTAKRARTVIDHIIEHGFISTDDLQGLYGYDHPPRAARDVRDNGIPLETFKVKSARTGRMVAAYKFGDVSKIKEGRVGGRSAFSKQFRDALIEKYESREVRRPLGVPRRKVESTLFSPILFSMVAGGWLGHPSQASRPRLQPARTQAFFPDGRCAA